MQGARLLSKTKLHNTLVTDGIGNDILKGTAFAFGAMAVGIIGAWTIGCLVAGVIEAGGISALLSHWFSAVSGI